MSKRRRTRSQERTTQQVMHRSPGSAPIRSFGESYQSPILQLQRTLGNRRVAQLIRARRLTPQGKIIGLQRKLTVGAADDQYEQEADRVARQVMSMPDISPANSTQPVFSSGEETTEEDKEKILQTKPLASEITPFVQRQTENSEESEENEAPLQAKPAGSWGESFEAGDEIESRINQGKGGGNPLPGPVRDYMEPRFGTDFSHVRVHTGSEAVQMNREVGASAFTHGADIYYGAGSAPENLELTAHELTHVIQQTGSGSLRTKRLNERSNKVSVQRTIGDGHDLTSPRFSGDAVLEACFDNERLLRVGSQGNAVSTLQQALIDAGFPLPKFGVDGIFGGETQTAVRDFQQASGITIDGLVGPQTMGALDTRFSGPTPPTPTPPTPTPPTPTPPTPTPPTPTPPTPTPPTPTPPTPTPPAPATITSETVATSPGVRTRTTIGVGEGVTLTHSAGSTTWATTAGTLSATTGATVTLTAPDTAQTVTVTAGGATIAFTVIAPSGVHMDRFAGTGIRHTQNFPDSGIQTRPFLLPDNVNFSNVQYHEVDIGAVANGTYSCHNGTGHDANPATLTLSSTVIAGKGTQANARDTVYSGHCGGTAPFTPGSLSFAIPHEYRVGTGTFRRFATVNQVHVLAADASTLTTDKAGAHGDTTVTAATSAF